MFLKHPNWVVFSSPQCPPPALCDSYHAHICPHTTFLAFQLGKRQHMLWLHQKYIDLDGGPVRCQTAWVTSSLQFFCGRSTNRCLSPLSTAIATALCQVWLHADQWTSKAHSWGLTDKQCVCVTFVSLGNEAENRNMNYVLLACLQISFWLVFLLNLPLRLLATQC